MKASKHYLFSGMKYRPSDTISARNEQCAANKIARGLHLMVRSTGPHSYILLELVDGADIPGTEFTITEQRIHTGYGIHVKAEDGRTAQYRHFSHKNYHLTERDAIKLAKEWIISDTETITVLDEGCIRDDFDHRIVYERGITVL